LSQTRATVRGRIKELLGDVRPAEPIFTQFRYDECINRNIQMFMGRAIAQDTTLTVSLVAGSYDYTVTAIIGEVKSAWQAFLSGTGAELTYLPLEELNNLYHQESSAAAASGDPAYFSLYESTTQVWKVRVAPTPASSGSLILYQSVTLDLPTSEGSSIAMDEQLIRALECAVAADLIETADQATLQAGRISRAAVPTFRLQAEQGLKDHNQRRMGMGRRQNYVLRRRAGSIVAPR